MISYTKALIDWGSFRFSKSNNNQYLARFAVEENAIFEVKARLKLKEPFRVPFSHDIKILLMNDKEWDLALETED